MEGQLTLHPPIHLVASHVACHRHGCGHHSPVVAIVASVEVDEFREIQVLSYIEAMPDALLSIIQERFPGFGRAFSHDGGVYYGNICPACGALSGDHYLQRPDGVFSPRSDEDIAELKVETLPIDGPITVVAEAGSGSWLDRVGVSPAGH